jgi:hypothetical protein
MCDVLEEILRSAGSTESGKDEMHQAEAVFQSILL